MVTMVGIFAFKGIRPLVNCGHASVAPDLAFQNTHMSSSYEQSIEKLKGVYTERILMIC